MNMRKRKPRMADVAKAAGVSTMTVSRAFSGDRSVTEARREFILRTADEMGYVFDRTASELRTRKTGFVAVTVPSINNPNFADSVRGVTSVLEELGLQVLLGFTDYDLEREEHLIGQLLRRRPEALVVTGGTHTQRARRMLEDAAVPIVETWDEPDVPIGYSVGFSNSKAGSLMAEHLISTGRKKLAFVGCDAGSDFRGEARGRGFLAETGRHGLDDSRYIEAGRPPLGAEDGARAARVLMQIHPDTDAVMCVADSVAFGALTELLRQGFAVPGDIAVAGFGAYDTSAFAIPAITTIEPKAEQIGVLAGKTIGTLLSGRADRLPANHAGATPILLARRSTAGPS